MPTVKHKGIAVDFGGDMLIIPPMALGTLEQLQDSISNFTGDVRSAKQVATVIDAAHAALKRNYPDITREKVAEMIDVGNMAEVFEAVMDISGLKRKELESQGEAPPGAD
ncbi:MAG: hypothetical protein XXXNARYT_003410 [Candidatus Accumulibacter regalis]|jgi:hypothetical protein|uniref:hypothetical protein n=1 Tax=Candidatus Accumulibacter sp. ACC005 TaxID=2823331 RepID=UPI0025C2CEB3|nr:hypothetical protein [Candidatus Accumulibacter sp. ACC005]